MIVKLERPIDARLADSQYVVRDLRGDVLLLLPKSRELRSKFRSWEYALYFDVTVRDGELVFLEKVRDPTA